MVTPTRYRTALLALVTIVLCFAPLPSTDSPGASAQVTGRSGGGGGGRVRVGCGALLDASGKPVVQEAGRGSGAGHPAHCVDGTKTATAPAPPPTPEPEPEPAPVLEPTVMKPWASPASPAAPAPAKRRVAPPPAVATAPIPPKPKAALPKKSTGTLEVTQTEREPNTMDSLSIDPTGASIALVTSGIVLWLVRSGVFASMLLFGLPIWRDVDLLAVVESDNSITPKGPHGDAGERLFSEDSDSKSSMPGRSPS